MDFSSSFMDQKGVKRISPIVRGAFFLKKAKLTPLFVEALAKKVGNNNRWFKWIPLA